MRRKWLLVRIVLTCLFPSFYLKDKHGTGIIFRKVFHLFSPRFIPPSLSLSLLDNQRRHLSTRKVSLEGSFFIRKASCTPSLYRRTVRFVIPVPSFCCLLQFFSNLGLYLVIWDIFLYGVVCLLLWELRVLFLLV